jgi:hypothetical protein
MRQISKLKNGDENKVLDKLNELIDSFNFTVSKFNLSAFDGQIIEVSFSAGENKVIPHKLGKSPKYRIILRQEGNGVLSDTPSGWNEFQIQIKNNGAVSVTATIMLLRE